MDTPENPNGKPPTSPPPAPPLPTSGSADEPTSLKTWFNQNFTSLLVTVVLVVLIFVYLNPWDVLKVAVGLGLVIFIHELGHFLAAKWCDVHVKTFSIGFGPPIPGCQFKYGETTYKLAMIPLGGYVYMIGEGESPDGEGDEGDDDPRSFKNKTVYQRMLIISAGVIMNIFLAAVCFVIAYTHGVDERPALIGGTESGSAAWRSGLYSGEHIVQIGDKQDPWFADIRPIVMSTDEGEQVRLLIRDRENPEQIREVMVEPGLEVSKLFPLLGVSPMPSLELLSSNRKGFHPYRPGSAASQADPPLEEGDLITGIGPGDDPEAITPVSDYLELSRQLESLQGQPIALQVARDQDGSRETVVCHIPPAYTRVFGMRMRMGPVVAVRDGSPAAQAGVRPGQSSETDQGDEGDRLIGVEVQQANGTRIRWVTTLSPEVEEGITQRYLDPVRLPFELEQWASNEPTDWAVRLTVQRWSEADHTLQDLQLQAEWDPSWRHHQATIASPDSPQPINGLGLAYQIETLVDAVEPGSPAEKAGIQREDAIKEVRARVLNEDGEYEDGRWIEIEPHQWAFLFADLQRADSTEITFRIDRGEGELIEVTVQAEEDNTWPVPERGIYLRDETQLQKADGVLAALGMGLDRTGRTITIIYQSLQAMLFGRVSAWTMSGPLTIADVSYKIAGEDLWAFLLFIGMISVNLAVINFLPIPVLDGGHMAFLIYEMIRGKPAPERVQIAATFVGLAFILSLMAFVIFLDVRRLWM